MLEAAGVSVFEEEVYRALVRAGPATVAELPDPTQAGPHQVRAALRALETRGLVSRTPGGEGRYLAAPPDVALEALILQRERDLHLARLGLADLTAEYQAVTGIRRPAELVEVVTGTSAIQMRFQQLQLSARSEVKIFDLPPYTSTENARANPVEIEQLGRGVRYRAVYDASALEGREAMDAVRPHLLAGEQARVVHGLPIKLAIADRSLALLPLSVGRSDVAPGAILVHACGLLDALDALFERAWREGVPVGGEPVTTALAAAVGAECADVVGLLIRGLTDKSVASHLGLSRRTVQRRARDAMDRLGASTRLQLGYQAARRDP